jgi:riboflavin kinase/FMN adenylyltransferase
MSLTGFHRIEGAERLPESLRGGVVAIGNFDGVHRGHRAVLDCALELAQARGLLALALTFEPHPRSVIRPEAAVARITPAPMKARILRLLGFDAVVEEPFNKSFAARPALEFIDDILVGDMGVSHVVTGLDFHFGHDRQGNPAFLKRAAGERGFEVTTVEAFCDEGGEAVSSTRVRQLLSQGDVVQAAGLLGYRYTVEGEVVHGKKLGRTLGFPTANMVMPDDELLRHGIYAVRLRRTNGELFDGVASYGRRPTVDEAGSPLLETYVFDFDGDLYWEVCQVTFFGFLRGEVKFDGLDALTAQMHRDKEEARALLASVRPLSELDLKLAF